MSGGPHGELSFRVEREPEHVFAVLADLERAPEWAPILSEMHKTTEGEVTLGSRFTGKVHLAGQTQAGELVVIECHRPEVFAYEGRGGPAVFRARFQLAPEDGGTRVQHRYQLELSGFAKMMAPVIGGLLEENASTMVESLRRRIEQG